MLKSFRVFYESYFWLINLKCPCRNSQRGINSAVPLDFCLFS